LPQLSLWVRPSSAQLDAQSVPLPLFAPAVLMDSLWLTTNVTSAIKLAKPVHPQTPLNAPPALSDSTSTLASVSSVQNQYASTAKTTISSARNVNQATPQSKESVNPVPKTVNSVTQPVLSFAMSTNAA
jgi:hypothetical protein